MRPGYIVFYERWASESISLIFDVIRCRLPPPSVYTNAFDDDYIRIFNGNYDPTCWMTFKHITRFSIPPPPSTTPPSMPATSVRPDYSTAPVTLVATSDNRMEHTAHVRTVSVSTSWEQHRRRRRSRHREPHRRRSRSRSHHRRPPGRPDDAVPTFHRRASTPKYPPAVKAMPACRPSGLSYHR